MTVRGVDALGLNFKLPTTEHFFNIFHPYDPVAYRIEALVNPDLATLRPVLVPHHKGRKRMHLELRETMARVGADLKHRIVSTFKNTLNTVYNFASVQSKVANEQKEIEQEVEKVGFCLKMNLKIDKISIILFCNRFSNWPTTDRMRLMPLQLLATQVYRAHRAKLMVAKLICHWEI